MHIGNCISDIDSDIILAAEERALHVESVFREGGTYSDLAQLQFAEKFPVFS